MKKLGYLILIFAFIPLIASAQNYDGEGTIDINAGIGVGQTLTGSGGLPLNLSVDYGYNENISFGGYLGFLSSTQNYGFGKFTYTNIVLGARGAYHFDAIDDFDTYAGVMLGYNIVNAKWSGAGLAIGNASASGLAYSLFVGGRYHFNEKIGAFAELGYGVAILQFGVTFKI